MIENNTGGRTLKTIENTVDILDLLVENNGARVSEIANDLDLAASTVHNYVTTLEQNQMLVKEGKVYHIGLKFLHFGGYARERKKFYSMIIEEITNLREETEERVQFLVEEHGRGYKIHNAWGAKGVRLDTRIGHRTYLHTTSAGKVILAHLSAERVEKIIDYWGLPEITPNTITDREELFDELQEIRDRGYAFNYQERVTGLKAVGAPIKMNDQIVGAISISGPVNRMTGERYTDELPSVLLGSVDEISLKITYQYSP